MNPAILAATLETSIPLNRTIGSLLFPIQPHDIKWLVLNIGSADHRVSAGGFYAVLFGC